MDSKTTDHGEEIPSNNGLARDHRAMKTSYGGYQDYTTFALEC
jgi:hypothetical protein